jgi:hypothetical protein
MKISFLERAPDATVLSHRAPFAGQTPAWALGCVPGAFRFVWRGLALGSISAMPTIENWSWRIDHLSFEPCRDNQLQILNSTRVRCLSYVVPFTNSRSRRPKS